jgi:aspartyl-tRNA(Asn)/glutamyl-tRNA(Gln) amidotransferase subunit C
MSDRASHDDIAHGGATRGPIIVDEALIERVAGLAKLRLTAEERARFILDFKAILDTFEVLDEADVIGVKNSFRPFEEAGLLREDQVMPCLGQEQALKFTEQKDDGFFIGPRTVG